MTPSSPGRGALLAVAVVAVIAGAGIGGSVARAVAGWGSDGLAFLGRVHPAVLIAAAVVCGTLGGLRVLQQLAAPAPRPPRVVLPSPTPVLQELNAIHDQLQVIHGRVTRQDTGDPQYRIALRALLNARTAISHAHDAIQSAQRGGRS